MTFQSDRREQLIKNLVSNAIAIISNQIALPLGVQKMKKIAYWIEQIEPLQHDFQVFYSYDKSTNDLPLGTERLNWNIEKLIELEVGIEKADMKYKYEILRNCKNIIDKYEKNKT